MRIATAALLLTTAYTGSGCNPESSAAMSREDSATVTARAARLAEALAQPARVSADSTADSSAGSNVTEGKPIAKWLLQPYLLEISGITVVGDGRLLAHADEGARVYGIDYRVGRMIGTFDIGKKPVEGDFEGITNVNDTLYMMTSLGVIYEFLEGQDEARVSFTKHDTGLKDQCEFEGVAFDPAIRSLLLPCKNVHPAGPLQDSLVIYRLKLPLGSESQSSRLTLPLGPIIGPNGWKKLHPSDIAVDPNTGNYVVIAADESALVHITPSGRLLFAQPLGPDLKHAEGVAITKDSILIISTEGEPQKLPSAVTLFRWP